MFDHDKEFFSSLDYHDAKWDAQNAVLDGYSDSPLVRLEQLWNDLPSRYKTEDFKEEMEEFTLEEKISHYEDLILEDAGL